MLEIGLTWLSLEQNVEIANSIFRSGFLKQNFQILWLSLSTDNKMNVAYYYFAIGTHDIHIWLTSTKDNTVFYDYTGCC